MERKATSFTIALSLLLLSLFFSPLFVVPVRAYGYDDGYGSASIMHACDACPITITELRYMYWAFNDIYNIFASRYHYYWIWWSYPYQGFWASGGHVYGHVTHSMVKNGSGTDINPYSTTTKDDVFNGIEDVDENHEYSSFLYVGHGGTEYFWGSDHYDFFMNGKGLNVAGGQVPKLWDFEIYLAGQVHAEDNHHFVFLWTCFNGYERGSDDPPIAPNGMPHCWTEGEIGTSTNGYDSPDGSNYCFIGFDLASPRLEEWHNGANHLYKHWLVFFYYYAVAKSSSPSGPVNSVKKALDKASVCQGFENFKYTRLYKKGPYYPKSGPPGQEPDPEYMDTKFLGLRDPENPEEWLMPPGWYDTWIRVYGDGNYYIPGDVYHY